MTTQVLFLCTGNSCRSQMAEGFMRELAEDEVEVRSAGVVATGLDPRAAKVMAEEGIDISGQTSNRMGGVDPGEFDLVVTLCNPAQESCPVVPGSTEPVHHTFDDPPSLARSVTGEEEKLEVYRRVRDEIRGFVEELLSGKVMQKR